ncbi:MAG: LIC11966 family surface protein [Bacteroidia bacterium]
MKQAIFLFLFAVSSAIQAQTGANPTFTQATDYNDYIVSRQMNVGQCMNRMIALLNDTTKTQTEAEQLRYELQGEVAQYRDQIKAMPAWNGSSEFRNAALDLFQFYYEMFSLEYAKVIPLLDSDPYTETEQKRVEDIFAAVSDREKILDAKFLGMQESFAKENGFILTPADETD